MFPNGITDCCKGSETTINPAGSVPQNPGELNYAQKSLQPMQKVMLFLATVLGYQQLFKTNRPATLSKERCQSTSNSQKHIDHAIAGAQCHIT